MRPATAVLFALLVVAAGCVGTAPAPGTEPSTTGTTAIDPGTTTRPTATGNGTPIAVHADWFTQYFRYHVDGDSLLRERAERGDA